MNIKDKALRYAIKKHGNQVRKAEREKPAIVHLIDVGNILEEYGFDDNVVAAGYLHDILEDTNVSSSELLEEFGEDISSLVIGASEEDRRLSWEERKLATINRIKPLDFRHKAVILADKISNTEDLINLFGRTGQSDFSGFNRGKDKKLWYWMEAYKSLVFEQDESHPMFIRLKKNLELIANDGKEKLDFTIFSEKIESDLFLTRMYYKGLEALKLNKMLKDMDTYVCCFLDYRDTNSFGDIKNYFDSFGLKVNYINLSWSDYEFEKLKFDFDECLFKKKIDERLRKIVEVIKDDSDIVFINSDFYTDMVKLDKIIENKDVRILKILRYYLDVADMLIHNIYVINCCKVSDGLGTYVNYFKDFLNSEENVYKYKFCNDIDSKNLCDLVVDSYKEHELSNIKKLIRGIGD